MNQPSTQTRDASDIDATVEHQRKIQREQDERDAAKKKSAQGKDSRGSPEALQAGTSAYPVPPLPAEHFAKPGMEADMQLPPQYLASAYRGSGKLQGMAALITGGDSGIGRAVAVLYAREGADVAIAYLNEHADAEETKRHVEAEGGRCLLLPGDVKDEAYCLRAVAQVVAEFGKLDVLVNNAAFQEHADALEDISAERLDETVRTNVYGYFFMAKAALPYLGAGSSIINSGSVVGLRGSASLVDYAATKGAIHAFTKSLASQLAPRGIRVNAVAPGPVWTPLNPADKPMEAVAHFGQDTDMKRPAQPEELSPAYVFLASPACASYITGIVLPVTGSVEA